MGNLLYLQSSPSLVQPGGYNLGPSLIAVIRHAQQGAQVTGFSGDAIIHRAMLHLVLVAVVTVLAWQGGDSWAYAAAVAIWAAFSWLSSGDPRHSASLIRHLEDVLRSPAGDRRRAWRARAIAAGMTADMDEIYDQIRLMTVDDDVILRKERDENLQVHRERTGYTLLCRSGPNQVSSVVKRDTTTSFTFDETLAVVVAFFSGGVVPDEAHRDDAPA